MLARYVLVHRHPFHSWSHFDFTLEGGDQLDQPELPVADEDLERISFGAVGTVDDCGTKRLLELLFAFGVPG